MERYRNLGEILTEVGGHFGFDLVSHVIVAWEDKEGNTRVSFLPYGNIDNFVAFLGRVEYAFNHPNKAIKKDWVRPFPGDKT